MPGGRATDYTPEIATRLCELLCSRDKGQLDDLGRKPFYSVRSACATLGIGESTIYQWLHAQPEFAEQYARARETRANLLAEETLEVVEAEPDPAKARVRMDVRKWYAGKLAPKVWGEKTVLAGDPDNPQKHEHSGTVHIEALTSRIDRITARARESGSDEGDQ